MAPLLAALLAASVPLSLPAQQQPELKWRDLREFAMEGQGWTATAHPYDRLPAKAEPVVRAPVWELAQDSAGMRYRFVTDATAIHARWKLHRPDLLALPHMPATGVSGLDLYLRDGEQWHWVGLGRPQKMQANQAPLVSGLPGERREFALYLPLYNGIDSIEIGTPEGAFFAAAADRYAGRKPIVFYGTSILQGGCASRPGMAYPSIIGRTLDWPIINLGFSGNAKSEPEMAALLAELDPALYVLDSLPNLDVAEVGRVEPFVNTIRAKHPATPIVLVENVLYTNGTYVKARGVKALEANKALRVIYDRLRKAGDTHLSYVAASRLLGSDGEDTVDGTHPSDLGFFRMAAGITPAVQAALRPQRK